MQSILCKCPWDYKLVDPLWGAFGNIVKLKMLNALKPNKSTSRYCGIKSL